MKKPKQNLKNIHHIDSYVAALFCLAAAILYPQLALSRDTGWLGRYKTVVTKDIFDPERGKQSDNTDTAFNDTTAEELQKRFQIYGVIINLNKKRAFIKDVKEKKKADAGKMNIYREVTTGDLLEEWKIVEITDEGVTVESKNKKITLPVFNRSKKERKANAPVALQTPLIKTAPPAQRQPSGQNSPGKREGNPGHFQNTGNGNKVSRRTNNNHSRQAQPADAKNLKQVNSKQNSTNNIFQDILKHSGTTSRPHTNDRTGQGTSNTNNPFLNLLRGGK
jgi:hypothetical protein